MVAFFLLLPIGSCIFVDGYHNTKNEIFSSKIYLPFDPNHPYGM